MAKKVSAATGQKQPDRATLNRHIRVQLNQDRGSQAWTKFLILIEGGWARRTATWCWVVQA